VSRFSVTTSIGLTVKRDSCSGTDTAKRDSR
jgi:hypothetical protein